jgi:Tat protein secretion system quality control protein TatD with DNase activity
MKNEPALVTHTLRALARARDITPDEAARVTTVNGQRLFGV